MTKARFAVGQTVTAGEGDEKVSVLIKAIHASRKGNVYVCEGPDGKTAEIPANELTAIVKTQKPSLTGTQTTYLLQGCPAEQITSLAGRDFTDIRVTSKWYLAVEEDDVIPYYTSVKSEDFVPSEETYPERGELICNVVVVEKTLYATFDEAIAASEENHFVLAGNSTGDLKTLITDIYPDTALERAENDADDGFTVLTLRVAE